jgi:hypothetical protein
MIADMHNWSLLSIAVDWRLSLKADRIPGEIGNDQREEACALQNRIPIVDQRMEGSMGGGFQRGSEVTSGVWVNVRETRSQRGLADRTRIRCGQ